MPVARGRFEVQIAPAPGSTADDGTPAGRLRVDKRFFGDLDASSRGEMLTALTPVEGSAGYVLVERVEGSLAKRAGSFLLQHYGVLDRGTPRQTIEVIPDSGTDGLTGLRGRMTIQIDGGNHSYELEYTLNGSA